MKKWDKNKKQQPGRRRQVDMSENSDSSPKASAPRSAFRRNSTLTGSTSSSVRGINESNSHLQSSRVQAHSLTHVRRRVGVGFSLVFCVSLLLLLTILQFTAESNVAVVGVDKAVNGSSYRDTINDYLSTRPIERLRFLLNEDDVTAYLQERHPEVKSLAGHSGSGFGSSVFELSVRQPVAVWTIEGSKFFVDDAGVSFSVNHYTSPAIAVVDESGVPLQAGVSIASNRFLSYVGTTIAAFKQYDKTVDQVIIPPNTTRQVEVRISGVGYPIKLSIDRPVGVQVEDASRAIDYIATNNKTVEYVDVRVGGKAFYR